jgi:hypothetical protein
MIAMILKSEDWDRFHDVIVDAIATHTDPCPDWMEPTDEEYRDWICRMREHAHPAWESLLYYLGCDDESEMRAYFRLWLRRKYGPDCNVQEFYCREEYDWVWDFFMLRGG